MNAAARQVEVRVPDMGNFKDVAVIDILVKPGESIEPEAPLVTLETEKATMDVPSTAGGVIEKLHVAKGGKVNAGDLIATVRSPGDGAQGVPPADASAAPVAPAQTAGKAPAGPAATEKAAPASPAPTPAGTIAKAAAATSSQPASTAAPSAASPAGAAAQMPEALRTDLPPINEPGFSRAHAGPSVRKFARELGVDLTRVAGHGFKGRITHDDVKVFVKSFMAAPGGAAGAGAGVGPGGGALPDRKSTRLNSSHH